MQPKHTPIRTWIGGFMTAAFISTAIAAYSFATDQLEYNPVVIKLAAKQDCSDAADPMLCVAERNKLAMGM